MSLNRNDIQILKEVFQPEFDKIHERFKQIDKRFEQIDKRFLQIDKRFENLETQLVSQFIAEIYELYTPHEEFNGLEKRVTIIEKKLQPS